MEHMQQLMKISELQLVYTSLLHSSNKNVTEVVRIFLNVPQITFHKFNAALQTFEDQSASSNQEICNDGHTNDSFKLQSQ